MKEPSINKEELKARLERYKIERSSKKEEMDERYSGDKREKEEPEVLCYSVAMPGDD